MTQQQEVRTFGAPVSTVLILKEDVTAVPLCVFHILGGRTWLVKPQSRACAIARREAEKVSNGCICLLWLLSRSTANGGLRTTEIYCRTVLEATSPKLRCQHSHAPSDGAREGSVPGLPPSFQ